MHITVICVGKIKEKFYTDALAEYQKRLSKYCKLDIVELADEKTKENASAHEVELVKAKEGERILSAIKEDMYVIALAIEGKMLDRGIFQEARESGHFRQQSCGICHWRFARTGFTCFKPCGYETEFF